MITLRLVSETATSTIILKQKAAMYDSFPVSTEDILTRYYIRQVAQGIGDSQFHAQSEWTQGSLLYTISQDFKDVFVRKLS
jgi:hypothetical protein